MHRNILLIVVLLPVVCLVLLVKPAIVQTDDHSRLLVLLRWQSGDIRFVNSVTGGPVRIHFRVGTVFRHFEVTTDETTEAYYTNGLYSMNDVDSKEAVDTLRFCSIKGIHLTLGFYDFEIKEGCLEVRLLWTV